MQSGHTGTVNPAAVDVVRELAGRVRKVVGDFIEWLDEHGETSQDQYDFWAARVGQRAKALYYARPIVGTIAVAPFVGLDAFLPSARALVRRRSRFPIADAHYAMAFFALHRADADERWVERAMSFLDQLRSSRCEQFAEYCWGYPFSWQTSSGLIPAGCPLITTTPYAYEAFESGYQATQRSEWADIMESIGRFVFESIPSYPLPSGAEACGYTPFDRRKVVNANAYRSFLLTTAGARFERDDWRAAGERNLAFVLECQRDDGSWPYAVDGRDDFIDNFHTCFVLKNLTKSWRITGDPVVLDAIRRGYAFYRAHLLGEDGNPTPFASTQRMTLYRRDLYDYAEGINLALLLEDVDPSAPSILRRLVDRVLESWVLKDGHFVTRQLLIGKNKVPYHRWAQSQTFHALARICERASES